MCVCRHLGLSNRVPSWSMHLFMHCLTLKLRDTLTYICPINVWLVWWFSLLLGFSRVRIWLAATVWATSWVTAAWMGTAAWTGTRTRTRARCRAWSTTRFIIGITGKTKTMWLNCLSMSIIYYKYVIISSNSSDYYRNDNIWTIKGNNLISCFKCHTWSHRFSKPIQSHPELQVSQVEVKQYVLSKSQHCHRCYIDQRCIEPQATYAIAV